MNRRSFLRTATGALSSAFLASQMVEHVAAADSRRSGFELKLLATSWGYSGTFDAYCARIKDAGYDGIELGWPEDPRFRDEVFAALGRHDLDVAFICIVLRPDGGFEQHLERFTRVMQEAVRPTARAPLYLDCHSGRDYYDFAQNKAFYDRAGDAASGTSLKVLHETHRSRMLYAPAVARNYMQQIPGMRIALDLSHWCVVSESLLEDQTDTVRMAIERTDAVSARVGHAQGPQVADPRAPAWAEALSAHLAWWDAVVELKRERGEPLTITPEFGPPDYMPTTPYERQPIADQWAINLHMLQLLRKRYATPVAATG